MAYHFLDSKLDRALVAYLISEGAATAENCFPALRALDKDLPNIVIHTADLSPPDGDLYSGSRMADVEVMITQAAVTEGISEAESTAARQAFNTLMGDVCDALMKHGQSADLLCDAINTAAYASGDTDLTDFAVDAIEYRGESQGLLSEGNWQKTFRLRCHVLAQSIEP